MFSESSEFSEDPLAKRRRPRPARVPWAVALIGPPDFDPNMATKKAAASTTKTTTKPAPAAAPTPKARRFTRSSSDRWIGGVAGGLARYFNIDVRLMRIITFVLCLTGAGLLAYILLWIFAPLE